MKVITKTAKAMPWARKAGEEGGAPDDDSEEEDGVFEYGGSCPDLDTDSDTDSLETTSTAIGATRASTEVQPSTSSSFEHRLGTHLKKSLFLIKNVAISLKSSQSV